MQKLLTCFVLTFFVAANFVFAEDATQNAAPTPASPSATIGTPAPAPAATSASTTTSTQTSTPTPVSKPPHQEMRSVEKTNYFSESADRLGHGFGNIAFSLLEWPYRVGKEMERTDPVAATVTGTAKGLFFLVYRCAAGAVEVATFFLPLKPLIRDFDAGWFNA